ncbi:MAG: thioredoxin family protein [Crocinitomicaceae bacterium]|nr:thioredoxin family protein [Crocinitomicaceae bacterium]
MFTELKTDTLKEEINEGISIVQYSAGWCGNCRMMKPSFKRMGEESEDKKFIVIDAEKNPESRKLATVNNLPTFAIFKDGEFVEQIQTNKIPTLKTFIDETTGN